MPYKDKETKKEHDRDYIQKKRGTTNERDDRLGTTEIFEGKPRYLSLSDGQVLDRANQPQPNKHLSGMIACNRADKTDLSRGISKAKRIAMIMRALDKTMTGLDGKPLKLGTMVRYGINGLTFSEIAELLT